MTNVNRTYHPIADSEFGVLMLAWASARYRENAVRILDQESASMLDEARSIVASLLSRPAYASDARLATFGRELEAAFLRKFPAPERAESAAIEHRPKVKAKCTCGTQHPDDPTPCPDCDSEESRLELVREAGPKFLPSVSLVKEDWDRIVSSLQEAYPGDEYVDDLTQEIMNQTGTDLGSVSSWLNQKLERRDREGAPAPDGSDPYPDRELPTNDRGDDYGIERKLALAHQALARFAEGVRMAGNDASELEALMEVLFKIETKAMVLLHG